MRVKEHTLMMLCAWAGSVHLAAAQLTIPGADNSDGALNVTKDAVIDLAQAVTGSWDANNSANAGRGIYDASKWAVTFKYSSVTVAAGATLTFKNHPSRAPVVWLVNGDVTIDGAVSVDGQDWQNPPALAEPGPGGFRGGFGAFASGVGAGPGFGPGGAQNTGGDRAGGSYGTSGDRGPATYGNPSLLPLIGGSGGSGDVDNQAPGTASGGGGGGAILIACSGNLGIAGSVRANGGNGVNGGPNGAYHSGGGSGGGIRLVCGTLTGNGVVNALPGGGYRSGGLGRIRIERVTNSNSLQVTPDPSVVTLAAEATALIWLPSSGPSARIVSIGSSNTPADPRASFGTEGPDVVLPETASTQVVVETTNVENASVVNVRVTPRANGSYTEVAATLDQVVSTTPLVIRWKATLPVNIGYSAVQARVIRP